MEALKVFLDFTLEMQESNSRLHKMEVLKKYIDKEEVKYFLNFIFSPYIVVGISRRKLSKDVEPMKDDSISSSKDLLEWLKLNNTGRDLALAKIRGFQAGLLPELSQLMEDIICKNIQIGVDTPTINKIWPGLIPTFNIMLAGKYFDNPEIVEGKEFTLTKKIDGGRIIAINEKDQVEFYTRAGQRYEGLVDLEEEMEYLPRGVYDGEITLLDSEGMDNKEQYKKTMMITRKSGIKHGVKMLVFDVMSLEEFKQQKAYLPYKVRRRILESAFRESSIRHKFFELLPALYVGSDTSKIEEILDQQIAKGEEGIMININDAPYDFNRSNNLLKVKKMHDIDLKVIGLQEGSGQNKGKLGAFIVDYDGFEVRVGSGISKEIREWVWANKENYVDTVISVQYFEETTNQAGGKSLRFPVFLDFRPDK